MFPSHVFLTDHNDVCEVCDKGGDLLCCDFCNLVRVNPAPGYSLLREKAMAVCSDVVCVRN